MAKSVKLGMTCVGGVWGWAVTFGDGLGDWSLYQMPENSNFRRMMFCLLLAVAPKRHWGLWRALVSSIAKQ